MRFASVKGAVRHAVLGLGLLSAPALAEERDLCPERPGLDTPPCIVDAGHILAEISAIDWTRDRQAGTRADTVLAGDALARFGLTDTAEAQIGWTAYGHARTRDAAGVASQSGVGDVLAAFKLNLAHPDGSGFSVALKPYATLPTGGGAIGAGTWGAGLLVPLSFDLGHGLQLTATPELDATPDQDRHGRHLAYGSAAGLQQKLSEAVSLAIEAQIIRDNDPSGHATMALSQVSLAWQPGKNTQLDIGAVAGLNHASPDIELIAGVSRRF
jgi:hypothetical protein